jgi:hypothetical protein
MGLAAGIERSKWRIPPDSVRLVSRSGGFLRLIIGRRRWAATGLERGHGEGLVHHGNVEGFRPDLG